MKNYFMPVLTPTENGSYDADKSSTSGAENWVEKELLTDEFGEIVAPIETPVVGPNTEVVEP
ncbi:MAG: hypothetical protein Q4C49_03205 [Bacillota bacterium]|nr:hypothetical protein [Bacillota bacterium]